MANAYNCGHARFPQVIVQHCGMDRINHICEPSGCSFQVVLTGKRMVNSLKKIERLEAKLAEVIQNQNAFVDIEPLVNSAIERLTRLDLIYYQSCNPPLNRTGVYRTN